MGIFEKALLNKSFNKWLHELVVETLQHPDRIEIVFKDFLNDYDNYPKSCITTKQKNEASTQIYNRPYLQEIFDAKSDKIVSVYADNMIKAGFENDTLIDCDNIEWAAHCMTMFLIQMQGSLISVYGGSRYFEKLSNLLDEHFAEVLTKAQDKDYDVTR